MWRFPTDDNFHIRQEVNQCIWITQDIVREEMVEIKVNKVPSLFCNAVSKFFLPCLYTLSSLKVWKIYIANCKQNKKLSLLNISPLQAAKQFFEWHVVHVIQKIMYTIMHRNIASKQISIQISTFSLNKEWLPKYIKH